MIRWNSPRRAAKAGAKYATKLINYDRMQRKKAQDALFDSEETKLFLESDPINFLCLSLEDLLKHENVESFADLTPALQAHFGKNALMFVADDHEFDEMSKEFKHEEHKSAFITLRKDRERVFANCKSPPNPNQIKIEEKEFLRTHSIEHLASFDDPYFCDFLSKNRDPQLWWAVVNGLNFDSLWTEKILLWLASQPDCENTIIVEILTLIAAPTYCGTQHASGYDELLKVISQREDTGAYPCTKLCDPPKLDRDCLIQQCKSAEMEFKKNLALASEKGLLLTVTAVFPIPYKILKKRPTGAPINSQYFYDETGIAKYVRNDEASQIPVEVPSKRAAFREQREPIHSRTST